MQVRKQQLELDMEQQTGSKYEQEYVKAVYSGTEGPFLVAAESVTAQIPPPDAL